MATNRPYEILAPVGDEKMFEASLSAGADAIYLAGPSFGARAYASNFNIEQLNKLVDRANKSGVKVFITVNTLVKDQEFEDLYDYLVSLAEIGPDALIIQDLGVYHFIKKYFPAFNLHASTQMTVNDLYGARLLEGLGFERVVLGRELALDEIGYISQNTSLDIEVFIHGSLCVSVSGQCLMSSLIGQRSGNRGRCAQPCRKTYDLLYKGKKISSFPESFLSAADLMTIDNINKLIESGVYSLKIEGRMKKPDYVYSVVQEYRKALEGHDYSKDRLQLVSNRKFTRGFIFGDFARNYYNPKDNIAGLAVGKIVNNREKSTVSLIFDKDIFIGDVVSLTTFRGKTLTLTATKDYKKGEKVSLKGYKDLKDQSVIHKIYSKKNIEGMDILPQEMEKAPIDIRLFVKPGRQMYLLVKYKSKVYRVESDYIVESPSKRPTRDEEIEAQLLRLGESGYRLENLEIIKNEEVFIAKSRLNELRRKMVFILDKSGNQRVFTPSSSLDKDFIKNDDKTLISDKYNLTYEYFYQINKDISLDVFKRIYSHNLADLKSLRKIYQGEIFYVMPRIKTHKDYERILAKIEENRAFIDGIAATSLGDIEALKDRYLPIHLEADLNIFNSYSLDFYRTLGITDVSLSHELKLEEIEGLSITGQDLEVVGYGKISQMLLKHCPASIIKGCKDDSKCGICPYRKDLEIINEMDRGQVFRNFGYSELLTDKAVDISNLKSDFDKTQVRNIRLVDRGEKDLARAFDRLKKIYLDGTIVNTDKNPYLGHYKLGVI